MCVKLGFVQENLCKKMEKNGDFRKRMWYNFIKDNLVLSIRFDKSCND